MSVKTDYRILGVGNPFIDRCAPVDDAFLSEHQLKKGISNFTDDRAAVNSSWLDSKQQETGFLWSLGGSGTNVVKTLAHLGNKCALLGKMGSDEMSIKIEERLAQLGVTSLLSNGKLGTGVVNCFITPDAERTMHAHLGSTVEFSENDMTTEAFRSVEHVHLEGYSAYFGKAMERTLQLALVHRSKISLDLAGTNIVEMFKPRFEELVYQIDYVFGNVEEMQLLTGTESIQEAAQHFDPSQTIVVTNGANGCWVKNGGESDAVHFEAKKVPQLKDTTGAGDFFDGGFIHGTLRKESVARCVAMGNLAASFVIQQDGAELPQDKWAELRELVSKV